jgi:predicted ATP-grasp superfamily ATP-dependent carboligase
MPPIAAPPDIRAIVTDAHLRNAVAGVRGLGRAGVGVLAAASRPSAAGRWSRHAAGRARTAEVLDDPAGFARDVAALAARHPGALVFPGREEALDALLGTDVPLAYPRPGALAALRDKRRLAALAEEAGLAAPATLAAATAGELRAAPPPVPCAIKPAHPGGALATAVLVATAAEAEALLAGLPDGEQLMVQERADGPLRAVALVVDAEGRVAERVQQEALRTWPADAGTSSRARTVVPDEDLVAACARLLAGAGHVGLAQLQFLAVGGRPALVDVNPRFYGSLPLALAAGANLPAAWHAVARGERWPGPSPVRPGVTYRWVEADLMAFAKGDRAPLREPVRGPRAGAMWAGDDPVPGVLLAGEAAWTRVGKRLPGRPGVRR